MALSDAKVRNLKPKKKRHIVWEDGKTGLGVRISEAGRKTFILMYRFEGRARMMSIGVYPRVSLADARLKTAKAKGVLAKGADPGKLWVEEKVAERNAETVTELVEEYLEKWARPRKRTAYEDERILRKDVIPLWGRRKAKSITRRDVTLLLDGLLERGVKVGANRIFAIIRKMFNFAVSRSILDYSPCTGVSAPVPENSRDRVLDSNEIKAFWDGLNEAKASEGSKLALKLQLLTAQRKGEVINAEWEDFDIKNKVWTIPSGKSKNRIANRVPLSSQALKILKKVKSESNGSGYLFPSPRSKDKPIAGSSIDHVVRRNLGKFGISPFVPHDLRRTAASQMTGMGIPRLVVSKILNHAESGITAIYDRHSYDEEKREALDKWSVKLKSITKQQANFF